MGTKASIVNRALSRLGSNKQIANIETENSREAIAARLIFDDERDYVLRDFPWPFATAYRQLGLVAEQPNGDWFYAYRYPSDCLYVRRVVTALGRREVIPRPFRVGVDDQGRLLFTNEPQATIEYTARVVDPERFDPLFDSMLAWRIAANLAPSLSRVKDMSDTALKMYEIERSTAQSRALNEGQQDEPLEAELIRVRD